MGIVTRRGQTIAFARSTGFAVVLAHESRAPLWRELYTARERSARRAALTGAASSAAQTFGGVPARRDAGAIPRGS